MYSCFFQPEEEAEEPEDTADEEVEDQPEEPGGQSEEDNGTWVSTVLKLTNMLLGVMLETILNSIFRVENFLKAMKKRIMRYRFHFIYIFYCSKTLALKIVFSPRKKMSLKMKHPNQ